LSGIAGVAPAEGERTASAVLARMMAATAHRAVHGASEVQRPGVALGCQLLDASGDGPAMSGMAEDADLVVSADCRLDNRDELLAALEAPSHLSDAGLILAAYRRWELEAPARLLGDFAFALWDGSRRRLLCVRDHFGIKPLYYHAGARAFAFSSEPGGVLASGWPSRALNEDSIAAFLAGQPPRPHETLYREVARLPPAHMAVVEQGRTALRAYWRLLPIDIGEEDVVEGVRLRLEQAVKARMRGSPRVGAKLSGGLDSSSVACLAAGLRNRSGAAALPTFSMVFDETPEQNERPQIEAVLAAIDAIPHFLPSNGVAHLAELPSLLEHQAGPFLAPNLAASRRLYAAARAAGVDVLLDGHGGDEAISFGSGRLAELAAEGRWFALRRELSLLARHERWPARSVFWGLFAAYMPGAGLMRRLRRLERRLRTTRRREDDPLRFLSPPLARRAAALQRENRSPPPRSGKVEQAQHLATLTGPLQAYALEILDRAAARAGVEARYPFWDKRLVEFCCSAPAEDKLKDGRTRALLRRSMVGVLPEAIRTRPDKFNFMPHFLAGLAVKPAASAHEVFPDGEQELEAFLSLRELRSAYDALLQAPAGRPPLEAQALWRCVAFARWRQSSGKDDSAR